MAILHPNTFYINNADGWSSNYKYDFWNYGNTDVSNNNNPVKKTIYSPSPTDYAEPKTAAFTGFTISGTYTESYSSFNVNGGFDTGWNFYCQPKFTGNTTFFSALGARNSNCKLEVVGTYGYYWCAGPSGNYARDLFFKSWHVDPQQLSPRTLGLSLRSNLNN